MSGKNTPKYAQLPEPNWNRDGSSIYSRLRERAYNKLCTTQIPDNSVESYRKIKINNISFSDFLNKNIDWNTSVSEGFLFKKISECSDDEWKIFNEELQKIFQSKENEFFNLLSVSYSKDPHYFQIPANTFESNLSISTEISAESGSAFPVYFLKIGKHSNVKLRAEISLPKSSEPMFIGGIFTIILEESSNLEIVFTEDFHDLTYHFREINIIQKRNSNSTISYYNFNGLKGKTKINTHLLESGSSTKIYGLAAPTKRESQDVEVSIFHDAGHTGSSLQFNTVMKDRAHHIFTGNLIIPKTSSRVEASQVNHNLMMDKTARAESMPKLEVFADDVKCSHGATMSEVDESQIFYLLSRGFDLPGAKHLIVEGFLSEIIEKTGSEELQTKVLEKLLKKLMV